HDERRGHPGPAALQLPPRTRGPAQRSPPSIRYEPDMNTPRLPRFSRISLCLFALSLLALAGCSSDVSYNAHDIAGVMPDMSFELTNEDGNRVDETAYADDRLTLMFFGYTHCPDICPMTLARLKAAMASLDEDVRNN